MAVLLVTERSDISADLVVLELQKQGVDYFRFNQDDFPRSVQVGWSPSGISEISDSEGVIRGNEISGVWYRRPPKSFDVDHLEVDFQPLGIREAGATLLGLGSSRPFLWMNPPLAVQRAENKLDQLCNALHCGLSVPTTHIGNSTGALTSAAAESTVLKPVQGGAVIREGKTYFARAGALEKWPSTPQIEACPSTFQALIDAEFHVRVVVIDDRTFVTRLEFDGGPTIDWRSLDDDGIRYTEDEIPKSVSDGLRRLLVMYGLRYCSSDFAVDDEGAYWFLDLNPSGQWGWIQAQTGQRITESMVAALRNVPAHGSSL